MNPLQSACEAPHEAEPQDSFFCAQVLYPNLLSEEPGAAVCSAQHVAM